MGDPFGRSQPHWGEASMLDGQTAPLDRNRELAVSFWVLAGLLAMGVIVAASLVGSDASWDFRNYHLYNPFALLNKPAGFDIGPAHMQTYFAPTMDLLYYGLIRSIRWAPALNMMASVPQAVAVVLAFVLTCRLLQPRSASEQAACAIFVAISATGAAGGSTIATTMSEMLPAALIVVALLLLIPRDLGSTPPLVRLFWAGVLVGLACGLKLTMSYVTIATAAVLGFIPRRTVLELATRPFLFGIGVLIGAVTLSGYWWINLWVHFANPFFPIFNDVFKSPLATADRFVDTTFLPRSLLDALRAPWIWTLHVSHAASESRVRDPRFALALLAAVICLVQAAFRWRQGRSWPVVFVSAWFLFGFVLWRLEFSIYRYLSVLELVSGTMMALVALPLARRFGRPWLALAGSGGLLAACLVVTVFPQGNRAPPGTPPLVVDLGPLSPDSMVLLLDNEPMAYLAVFADPRVRFIATNDFFMTLDATHLMRRQVEAAIKGQRGPLWGLDSPPEQGDRSEQTLKRYDLVRGACRPVRSNVSPLAIRLCRLEHRDDRTATPPPPVSGTASAQRGEWADDDAVR